MVIAIYQKENNVTLENHNIPGYINTSCFGDAYPSKHCSYKIAVKMGYTFRILHMYCSKLKNDLFHGLESPYCGCTVYRLVPLTYFCFNSKPLCQNQFIKKHINFVKKKIKS